MRGSSRVHIIKTLLFKYYKLFKGAVYLYWVYRIAVFYCENFNLAVWALHNIKIHNIFNHVGFLVFVKLFCWSIGTLFNKLGAYITGLLIISSQTLVYIYSIPSLLLRGWVGGSVTMTIEILFRFSPDFSEH